MFNELQRLRHDANLARLLTHYTQVGAANRDAWQDRLMEMEGVAAAALVQLHGELLAHAWIELNPTTVPITTPGTVPQCYRVTPSGLKALRRSQAGEVDSEDTTARAA